jgi:hypothetical protein
MIVPDTQRYMAERMKVKMEAHAVDHTPSVTTQNGRVDIIRDAMRSVPATQACRDGYHVRSDNHQLQPVSVCTHEITSM